MIFPSFLSTYHHTPMMKYYPHKVELHEGYDRQKQIYAWCDEMFGLRTNIAESRWYISSTGCGEIYFWSKNIEDCVAFKLRWL